MRMIMCQYSDNGNPRIVLDEPVTSSSTIEVVGSSPINVIKTLTPDTTKYSISVTLPPSGNDGKDGKDGVNGKDGISASIKINQVTSGTTAQVTNVGTDQDVRLNIVLPKGADGIDGKDGSDGIDGSNGTSGIDGKDGLTKGIKQYILSDGGSNNFSPMGNYSQGTYVDTGDSNSKKLRIKAWVTVGAVKNWTTLRLTSSSTAMYNGSTLLKQIVKHSEGTEYVGEWEMNHSVTTSDRYIGFTFGDNVGGNYSSDGATYSTYGVEVFVLD